MELMRRVLLVRTGECAAEPPVPLDLDGWAVVPVDLYTEPGRLAELGAAVGIALVNRVDAAEMRALERLTASPDIDWIALVRPEILATPDSDFSRLVLDGFHDYHTLPVDCARLRFDLGHAFGRASLRAQLRDGKAAEGVRHRMIGRSRVMRELFRQLDKVAKVDAPVLIGGETGTGKELAARAIHRGSSRAGQPFVAVNCGSLPATLIQSELFGYERGAFTGAHQRKVGSIEAASGGTLFLDEIGDLPLESQATLLRFLQEKTIVRLGSTQPVSVDVRVVAATHIDLEDAVRRGAFREDLFYRLNVLHLRVPALRHRSDDIELIAQEFFRDRRHQRSPQVQGFSREARDAMRAHHWPGNVRELLNRVQNAMVMSENRLISPADLGLEQDREAANVVTLHGARAKIEQDVIRRSLLRANHNVSQAARQLGISRVTMYRLMSKFSIDAKCPV